MPFRRLHITYFSSQEAVATNTIRLGSIVRGPTLPEAIEVLATVPMGNSLKVIGRGLSTGLTHDPVLSPEQVAGLTISADQVAFDGNARLFRLGIEAYRLGLAYEYDPFFSLSIARVDPLPHQLEAVYGYFMQLPRIRFLLADTLSSRFAASIQSTSFSSAG